MRDNRFLIPILMIALLAAALAATLPALVTAQADPTVEAAVQAALTQTAEAQTQGISTEAFGQTVDAAVFMALTATAEANTTPEPEQDAPAEETTPMDAAPVVTPVEVPAINEIAVLPGHEGVVNAADITNDALIASAGVDGNIVVQRAEAATTDADDATEEAGPYPLVISHDVAMLDVVLNTAAGEIIASGSDGRLYRYDLETGEPLPVDETAIVISGELPAELGSQGTVITDISADGTRIATFDFNGLLGIWQYPEFQATYYPELYNFALVDFSQGIAAYTTQDEPGVVQVAPLDDINTPAQQFQFEAEFAEPIAFSDDGTRLLILGDDGLSRVINLESGEIAFTFAYTGYGLSAFSPDGTLIADGGIEGMITLFDGTTGDILTTLVGHTAPASEVTFSAGGRYLASTGEDGNVLVWELGGDAPQVAQAEGGPTPLPEGFPEVVEAEVQVAEQVFEGGRMFWVEPVNQIWVMDIEDEGQGRWLVYEDTFDENTDIEEDPNLEAPEGLIEPVRGFGKLWRENDEVRDTLGWAVTPEFGYVSQYRYVPGGEMVDGDYVPGPGVHVLFSLNGEEFRFNEASGTWQLGG